MSPAALMGRCAAFRVDEKAMLDPAMATKAALRAVARRIRMLGEEVEDADRQLRC